MYYLSVIVIFILSKICISETTSQEWLDKYDPSICPTVVSYMVSEYVPYEETYKQRTFGIFYRTKTRVNYKIEYRTDLRMEKKCCLGYRDEGISCKPICSHVCRPICTKECRHGKCVQPETCRCEDGYWLDSDGFTCRPSCEPSCEATGGFCLEPNVCVCREGYEPVKPGESSLRCRPICVDGCRNGRCVAPNDCRCEDGYARLANGTVCEPICVEPCVHGTCILPDVCVCRDGYQHAFGRGDDHACYPICRQDCLNGNCTAPNVCACRDGYETNEEGQCVASCKVPCANGSCVRPDTCGCDEGFVLRHGAVCEPICENCENGECHAPNDCRCRDGFVERANGTAPVCVEACARNCSGHGSCVYQDEACDCTRGWSGWNCDEPTVCVSTLEANGSDGQSPFLINRIPISNEMDATNFEAYSDVPYCDECANSFDNAIFCVEHYTNFNGTGPPTVTCYFSTDLACNGTHEYRIVDKESNLSGPIVTGVVLTTVCLIFLGYFVHRLYCRKPKQPSKDNQGPSLQGPAITESLISEEAAFQTL